ncbi:transposable element Tcb1 transposase [Trichonephila clavipes]|nr:transposable element Tcb1 transposase [Trichonephila clavipes]
MLYTARMSQDCLRTVATLPWPARTPNLSSIEHIWDHLGRRVGHPTSLNEQEARLQQIWNEMSQDTIQNLYADRIASCIHATGGWSNWLGVELKLTSLRIRSHAKTLDFHDAENRQRSREDRVICVEIVWLLSEGEMATSMCRKSIGAGSRSIKNAVYRFAILLFSLVGIQRLPCDYGINREYVQKDHTERKSGFKWPPIANA